MSTEQSIINGVDVHVAALRLRLQINQRKREALVKPPSLIAALKACIESPQRIDEEQTKLAALLEEESDPVKREYIEYQIELVALQLNRAAEVARQRHRYLLAVTDWEAEKQLCKSDILHWYAQWAWTLDPREDSPLAIIPFDPFPFQEETIKWLDDLVYRKRSDGVVEKSRDQGWTWISTSWSTYHWWRDAYFQALFGSKNEDAVDSVEEPDTILEKVRFQLRLTPLQLLPKGFNLKQHMGYMKITNPENGSVIAGEAPISNFGRSGRYTCLAGDTLIATSEGLTSIRAAIENRAPDVLNRDGESASIQGYLIRRPEPLLSLTTKYGFQVRGSYDHPLLVERGGVASWRVLGDIAIGDRLVLADASRFHAPGTSDTSDGLARILGYLVSEGCVNKKSHIEFAQKDLEIMEDFQRAWEGEFGERLPQRLQKWERPDGRVIEWYMACGSRMRIRERLAQLGLSREKAAGKHIPSSVLRGSRQTMRAFLQALFEGDGSVSYSKKNSEGLRVSYTSKSFRLLRELQNLLLFFGIVSSVRKDGRSERDIGMLIIGGHGMAMKFCREIGFRSARKQAIWQSVSDPLPVKNDEIREGGWALPVTSVEESGIDYTYDFQVERHEFLANGFISHNCVFFDEHSAWPFHGRPQWTAASASSKSKISASTPQGTQTKQAELANANKLPKLTLRWNLHPWKDERWYRGQTLSMDEQEIAQEIDIDYEASQPGPIYAKLWMKQYHVIKWSQFEALFGAKHKPQSWPCAIYQDVGTSVDHPTATGWYTRPTAHDGKVSLKVNGEVFTYDLTDTVFLYRTMTIYDEEIGNIWDRMAELMRPHREREQLRVYRMSHEAESERKTLRKNGVLPGPVGWTPGRTRGIAQFKAALKLKDLNKPNPFKPELQGRPEFVIVVADEQYEKPLDDFGMARFQAEIAAYHMPQQVIGEPVKAQTPYAFFNDHMDQSRIAAADGFVQLVPLTKDQQAEARLQPELQQQAIVNEVNPVVQQMKIQSRELYLKRMAAEASKSSGSSVPSVRFRR